MADRNLRIRMLLEAGERVSRPLRDIASGSTRAAQALKATRDRLKEIERAQTDIAGFRQLKTELKTTGQELDAARQRAAQLARTIKATDNPTRTMVRDFAKAKREAADLGQAFDQHQLKLQQVRDRLSAAGISTRHLGAAEQALRADLKHTNAELSEQGRRMVQLNDRTKRFAQARNAFQKTQMAAGGMAASGAAAIGTGVAIGTRVWGGVKQAQEYESAMTSIGQKANLSRKASAELGRSLLVSAKAANQLPEAMAQGVDALAGFGLTPQQSALMMKPIGKASTAYQAEVADLSAAAFAAKDNLKVPVDQAGRVIDIMAEAGKQGAFEIKDMAGSFPSLTAGYQALGQTGLGAVADLSAALQIARKGAGDSASAANNVANVIQKISSPATIKAFSKYGIDLPKALKKAYAEGKTPLEAIAELTKKATGGDLGKMGFLFEDAQVQQGLRPLIQNLEEYRRIRDEASNANGVTDRDFADRMKDSAEQSKMLEVNAKALGITLGAMLLPTVNAVTQRLTAFAGWVGKAAEQHPLLAKAAVIGTAALAALFVLFGTGAIILAGIMGPIAIINAGLTAMGVAGGVASIGLAPIIGIVLAVVGAIALLYAAWNHWPEISAAWFAFWGGIRNAFVAAGNWLATTGAGLFKMAGKMILQGLLLGIDPSIVLAKIRGIAQGAVRIFKSVLGIHSPSRVFAGLGGFMMQGLTNGIAGGENAPVDRLQGLSRRMTSAMAVGAMAGAVGAPAAAAGGGGGAPTPITIQIYGAPGQSEEKIAELVAKALAKAQGSARSRATYADQDEF